MITAHFIGGPEHGKDRTFDRSSPPPTFWFPGSPGDVHYWSIDQDELSLAPIRDVEYRCVAKSSGYVIYEYVN